ncbi:Uncharacterised protein [Mycobacteroides abscessus subsp. abscessus]|nr:Uncharacterised protein [Mycobacteroides abscessus subsp. abscessus]
MQTMPDNLIGKTYYHPTTQGSEAKVKERLEQIKAWHAQHPDPDSPKTKKKS